MKTLIAIIALLASSAAFADSYNLVCGEVVITVTADETNTFESITVDNVLYAAAPTMRRKVYKGQMHTFFMATNPRTGVSAVVNLGEDNSLYATLDKNGVVWDSACRFTY